MGSQTKEGQEMKGRRLAIALIVLVVVAAVSVSAGLASRAGTGSARAFPTGPVNLTMWWWGEQEAAGAKKWLADTDCALPQETPERDDQDRAADDRRARARRSRLRQPRRRDRTSSTSGVASGALEDAWAGSTKPVSDYIPASELKHYSTLGKTRMTARSGRRAGTSSRPSRSSIARTCLPRPASNRLARGHSCLRPATA